MPQHTNYFYEQRSHRPCLIMGILNVTPDSFAEVEHCDTTEKAVTRGLQIMEEGADIIDIGGESTRPGAADVSTETELSRLLPVLEILIPRAKKTNTLISVDTRKPTIMQKVINLGVDIINHITNTPCDKAVFEVIGQANTPIIFTHMRGSPQDMKSLAQYQDLMTELRDFFTALGDNCQKYHITNIAIDPGLGFAKNEDHNIKILQSLREMQQLRYPLCIGWSRKRSIDKWFHSQPRDPVSRDLGSIIGSLWCMHNDVRIVRVHDVKNTRRSLDFWQVLNKCSK